MCIRDEFIKKLKVGGGDLWEKNLFYDPHLKGRWGYVSLGLVHLFFLERVSRRQCLQMLNSLVHLLRKGLPKKYDIFPGCMKNISWLLNCKLGPCQLFANQYWIVCCHLNVSKYNCWGLKKFYFQVDWNLHGVQQNVA